MVNLQDPAKEPVGGQIGQQRQQHQGRIGGLEETQPKIAEERIEYARPKHHLRVAKDALYRVENGRRCPCCVPGKYPVPMFEEKDHESAVSHIRLDDIEAAQQGGAMKDEKAGTTCDHNRQHLLQEALHIV